MQGLRLSFGAEPLRLFPIRDSALEIGANSHCDIVVHDPKVLARHAIVERISERRLRLIRLDAAGRLTSDREIWQVGESKAIGVFHRLMLEEAETSTAIRLPAEPATTAMSHAANAARSLTLLVGRGRDARRYVVSRSMHVGSSSANDIVLEDRTVSASHLRFEPTSSGLLVRDLGSRNGTWLNGMRIDRAYVERGARLCVGKTDLYLVDNASETMPHAERLVAGSASMLRVIADVDRYASLTWPVLIRGESGAGKEGLARRLHAESNRAKGPYVVVNAACIPRELIESELFGHERGAFTGAQQTHEGVFEQADGGTLFLDEVGELSPEMQSRLLRVLESWEVRRVGGARSKRVDVRLVCATHRDLRAMVEQGAFRLDLYYRLARLVIAVPPLRERPEDIALLSTHFLELIAPEMGERVLTAEARACLLGYDFPGNARELRNILGVAALAATSTRIDIDDIEHALIAVAGRVRSRSRDEVELREALRRADGNYAKAARALGIARSTLRDRLGATEPPPKPEIE